MVDHYPEDTVRVPSGDARIAIHEFGGASSLPPLVISHATGFHAHAYRALAGCLADRFHVWGLDHRGHGVTASPDGDAIDWADCGADTAAVGRVLAPNGGLVGVGHSMGAATLLLAARRDPRLFSRLILFEPIAFPPDDSADASSNSSLAVGARRRRRRFDSYDQAYDNYASKPPLNQFDPQVLRDYVDFGFFPVEPEAGPDESGVGESGVGEAGVQLRCSPEMESATFGASMTSGLWNELPHITTPVVVIGSGDGGFPALVAPDVAQRLAHGRFVSFPDQNHFGPLVDPAALAAQL